MIHVTRLDAPAANDLPKRIKGTGTIIRREDGKFRALFPFQPGTREEIDGSPFETYADAERALAALILQLRESGATTHGLPLRKIAEKCLDAREAAGYRNVKDERNMWSSYLEEHEYASVPLALITKGEWRAFFNGLRGVKTKKPLELQTKKNVRNLVSAIYEYAIESETRGVDENLVRGMKIKNAGRTTEEMHPLTLSQAIALLEVATDLIVPIAIGTGMRSSELRALRWADVHLEESDPHVMVRFGKPPAKPRKNGAVLRISLFGIALEAFRALAAATPEEDRNGIVFKAIRGGYRPPGRAVGVKAWGAWLTAAKIDRRVRFHDLRHTCATLLLAGDHPSSPGRKWTYEEVKELLGHSSVKVTERYAKVLGTLADKAAAEVRRNAAKPAPSPPSPPADQIQMRSTPKSDERTEAREILERRGSDSNRRMTVLQTGRDFKDAEHFASLWIRAGSYVRAVAEGKPLCHTRGLELAEAVYDYLDAVAARGSTGTGDR